VLVVRNYQSGVVPADVPRKANWPAGPPSLSWVANPTCSIDAASGISQSCAGKMPIGSDAGPRLIPGTYKDSGLQFVSLVALAVRSSSNPGSPVARHLANALLWLSAPHLSSASFRANTLCRTAKREGSPIAP